MTSATNPESGIIDYTYDLASNLLTRLDARSPRVQTAFTYDDINRVRTRAYSDGTPTVTYNYDGSGVPNSKGRLTQVDTAGVSTTNYTAYDRLGRVTAYNQVTAGQTYLMVCEYNKAGPMTEETYPSLRAITTSYDGAGRISSVNGEKTGELNKPYASSFSYSPHASALEMKLGNNLWEHASFNSRLQPLQIGLGTLSTDSSKLRLDYSFGTSNNNGNVLSQIIVLPGLDVTQSYTYDGLNRLTEARRR